MEENTCAVMCINEWGTFLMFYNHIYLFSDIDECISSEYRCGENDTATCVNTIGSYDCTCRVGFEQKLVNDTVVMCKGT